MRKERYPRRLAAAFPTLPRHNSPAAHHPPSLRTAGAKSRSSIVEGATKLYPLLYAYRKVPRAVAAAASAGASAAASAAGSASVGGGGSEVGDYDAAAAAAGFAGMDDDGGAAAAAAGFYGDYGGMGAGLGGGVGNAGYFDAGEEEQPQQL